MAMSNAERAKRLRQRRKSQGMRQVELWLSADLMARAEKAAKDSQSGVSAVLLDCIKEGLAA
jgi:hypothetical protein